MSLYDKSNYINESITSIIGSEIYEYDIKSAGTNLLYRYGYIDKDKYDYLINLPKHKRVVEEGLMQREDESIREALKVCFSNIRKEIFEVNGLDESDVLSIKKDAIFTTKKLLITKFDNIELKMTQFTSYLRIKDKKFTPIEIYYNSNSKKMDIKGISDEVLDKHREYMIDFIDEFLYALEKSNRNSAIKVVMNFVNNYVSRNLLKDYYRPLNSESKYVLDNFELVDIDDDMVKDINITYNYFLVVYHLLPLVMDM